MRSSAGRHHRDLVARRNLPTPFLKEGGPERTTSNDPVILNSIQDQRDQEHSTNPSRNLDGTQQHRTPVHDSESGTDSHHSPPNLARI